MGRSKCHFLALENGHFRQKCPFSSAQKWHFERPNLRTESKNLAKHPPKWWGRHLVHAFPFSGEYQANFENHVFRADSGPFTLYMSPKFQFICRLWVYNVEQSFGGSGNQSAPVVQPTKQNLKNKKLGHPNDKLIRFFIW